MRTTSLCLLGLLGCAAVVAVTQACSSSSSSSSGSPAADAGDAGEGPRVIACPPATDAGVAAAADAGLKVKILKPTNGQKFTTNEKVPFQGTGSDPTEPTITDKTRMIWNIGDAVKGISPDGEGPEDQGGPYPAGTYTVRFDVSTKACLTGADSVTITVE